MRKIFLIAIMLLSFTIAFSQHLTYSTFMKVVKCEGVSELNEILDSYGYNYGGINVVNKGATNEKKCIYWVKNCVHNNGMISFDPGAFRSWFLYVIKPNMDNDSWFEYSFHTKKAYKTFISTAKQNGFKLINDGAETDVLYSNYVRNNKTKKIKEYLRFYEYSEPKYMVMYWAENLDN